jgi:hypothetical protein
VTVGLTRSRSACISWIKQCQDGIKRGMVHLQVSLLVPKTDVIFPFEMSSGCHL